MYCVYILTAILATHYVVCVDGANEVSHSINGSVALRIGHFGNVIADQNATGFPDECNGVDGVPLFLHGLECRIMEMDDVAISSLLDHVRRQRPMNKTKIILPTIKRIKRSSCPVGEHRCYIPNYRTSLIKPNQCTGGFRPDSDSSEKSPSPDGLWSLSTYLWDNSYSWSTTRSDYLAYSETGCEQLGYHTPTSYLKFDWTKTYVWYKPDGCLYFKSGGAGLRLECLNDNGVPVPLLLLWHKTPVFIGVETPAGTVSISTVSRVGTEFSCQWSWSLIEINSECGPYSSVVKTDDCNHSFCVYKPT